MVDGVKKWTPCSPGDPEKVEMTYNDVKSNELQPPVVTLRDFENALDESSPTVNQAEIDRQTKWTNDFGVDGA